MKKLGLLLLSVFSVLAILLLGYRKVTADNKRSTEVVRIEMWLSAFGVESDGFPSISAVIDLKNDTSYCSAYYYDPTLTPRTYRLSKEDMDKIRNLFTRCNVKELKENYKIYRSDQATSDAVFYLASDSVKVEDYGLQGPSPLKELYELVYKLKKNVR